MTWELNGTAITGVAGITGAISTRGDLGQAQFERKGDPGGRERAICLNLVEDTH